MQYYFEFLIILIKLQHKILDSYTGADVLKKKEKKAKHLSEFLPFFSVCNITFYF